jgi:hypothetical protein
MSVQTDTNEPSGPQGPETTESPDSTDAYDATEAARTQARMSLDRYNRGQTNLVGLLIGLLIAGIVLIDVFIPVMLDSINSSNASGSTATILGLLPLFGGLLLLVSMASPLMRRI